jgi:hypothetical protein
MFARFLEALFGCWHPRYSFPITIKQGPRSRAAFLTGTYVVCLDCGKEMPYDWNRMKIVHGEAQPRAVPSLLTKQAA